jgi:hypothetical protein
VNINPKLVAPCMECKKRYPICHDSCEGYKQFKQNKEEVKTSRAEFMKERSIMVESVTRRNKHR